MRRRRRSAKPLSLEQKLDIAHRAIVGGEVQMDLAKEFRVSQKVVSVLVNRVRKKPQFLRDLVFEKSEKQLQDLQLAEFIEAKIERGVQIRTVKQVRDDYEATTSISLKEHRVLQVMKGQLGLRYRRIARLAP